MISKSYSQAGQDLWVDEVLNGRIDGLFLDVGANDPIIISNTYALESQAGWRGFLLDNDPNCICDLRAKRESIVVECDSTKFNYCSLGFLRFDYLSLDVDAATLDSLKKLLSDGVGFRCATVEHDSYRFGPEPRDAMRKLLTDAGYHLERPDVCNPEAPTMPYEDWWIHPDRT